MFDALEETAAGTAVINRLAELLTPEEWLDRPSHYIEFVQRHSPAAKIRSWDPYSQVCTPAAVARAAEHHRLFRWAFSDQDKALDWLEAATTPTCHLLDGCSADVLWSAIGLMASATDDDLARVAQIAVALDTDGRLAAGVVRRRSSNVKTFDRAVTAAKIADGTPVGFELLEALCASDLVSAYRFVHELVLGNVTVTAEVLERSADAWERAGSEMLRGVWAATARPSARQISEDIRNVTFASQVRTPSQLLWYGFAPPTPANRKVLADVLSDFADDQYELRSCLSAHLLSFFTDDIVVAAAGLCDARDVTELIAARPQIAAAMFAQATDPTCKMPPILYDAAANNVFTGAERAALAEQQPALSKPVCDLSDWADQDVAWYVTYRLGDDMKAWQVFSKLAADNSELSVMDLLDVATSI